MTLTTQDIKHHLPAEETAGPSEGESPAEYIRRVADWSNWQQESLFSDLPNTEALFELHHLVTVTCDTDMAEDAWAYCDKEQARAINSFIKKHKLKGWNKAIGNSEEN